MTQPHMILIRSMCVIAVVMAAGVATLALAQTKADLEERCAQLLAFYDRYGVGRSNNSDGRRNHTRIGAGLDCEAGQYKKGIAIMEDLLGKKNFSVPRPAPRTSVPPLESPEYGVGLDRPYYLRPPVA
ncbi:MAG: hypothetical protein ACXWKQ_16920 [Reyranella sp.]